MFDLTRIKKRVRSLAVGLAASGMVMGNVASVAALSSSSLSLSDPRPSETGVTYTFDTSSFSGASIQCFQIVFSANADGTGGIPTGMDTTGADMISSTSITEANWDAGEDHSSNGTLEAQYGTGEVPSNGNFVFNGIDNPTTDATFFATFTTYTDACVTADDSVVVAFATKDGTPVSVTIEPTLTFTCTGLNSGSVNGATITADSTGSSIDFGNAVTSSINGVSAHDLDVTTNASGGYVVYIRHTGDLTNGNSDTITSHTGTNLSPSTMTTGTEGWGYTTTDNDLSAVGDGADRFTNPGNEWAGFTTSNEEVMLDDSTTVRVGHQVSIAAATEAGTYTTNIVYTVVATF